MIRVSILGNYSGKPSPRVAPGPPRCLTFGPVHWILGGAPPLIVSASSACGYSLNVWVTGPFRMWSTALAAARGKVEILLITFRRKVGTIFQKWGNIF